MVKTNIEGAVQYIELNNPDKGNCLSPQMITEIKIAFLEANKNKAIKNIVLTGSGKNFCTGADLNWMYAAKDLSEQENIKDMHQLTDMYKSILAFQGIIAARAQGNVLGGGMGLVTACDVVVADKESKFSLPEKNWGLIPGIITPLLNRKIGTQAFNDLAESSRVISANEALNIGLIDGISSSDEEANELVYKLAAVAKKPQTLISDETFSFFTEESAKLRRLPKFIKNIEIFLKNKT
ncbi:MAG: enoyl-CoA hydratase/isomerase family protein [Pseudobdellovibrio sp.]